MWAKLGGYWGCIKCVTQTIYTYRYKLQFLIKHPWLVRRVYIIHVQRKISPLSVATVISSWNWEQQRFPIPALHFRACLKRIPPLNDASYDSLYMWQHLKTDRSSVVKRSSLLFYVHFTLLYELRVWIELHTAASLISTPNIHIPWLNLTQRSSSCHKSKTENFQSCSISITTFHFH